MALTDKDIVITPNRGSSNDPQIVFSGADASTSAQNITLKVYPTNGGTLSFEGSAGQLLSVVNTMSGTIFSANDISGIPSIEVLDTGVVKLAQYNGNVLIGTGQNNSGKLQITGSTWSNTLGGDVVIRNSNSVGSALTLMPTNSSSYSAGWSVYAGASGSAIGDGAIGFYNHTGNAYRLKVDQSGNLTVPGYMYAPRFVDSDNNSYYLDPAGTSVLNNLSVAGSVNQFSFGPERQYYLGNIAANGTQARRVEVARVFIDYNDWHSAGTIFVELQNSYFFGGDWQKWAISYDYNNVHAYLIEGASPRGRYAQVTTSSPVQISGDYYYISIYVDVRYYGQYYAYLKTSWPASSSPSASGQSGYIYVYTDPATTPGYSNISDFTPNSTITTNNSFNTGGDLTVSGTIYKGGATGYYINLNGGSNIGSLTTNGRLVVNDGTYAGGVYLNGGQSNSAYIGVNRYGSGDGQVGFQFRTADSTRWYNYMETSDNNTLRWYSASGTALTLSQAGSLVAYSEMQAPVFYHKDNTGYYLKPASTTDAVVINGHIKQGTLVSRPYVAWGASGGATGQVIIKFPGTSGNYGMIHAVVDIYEYNGNAAATVIVGGHNWNGAWYNYNAQVIGYTDKQVRVGFHGGQYCISIGSNGSTWSYGQVVLRKIQNGAYYTGIMDLAGSYNIYIDSNGEAGYSWVSGNLTNLRTPSDFRAEGYIYGARFVDTASSSYYVDPASGSYLGGTIYKDGNTVPWVVMQDSAPSATQYGDLWYQTSTGRLKIRYYDGSSAQWVDTSPVPDLSTYYSKAGGVISGSVSINGGLDVGGYIYSSNSVRTSLYKDGDNQFLFRTATNSSMNRIINLADSTSDPSQVVASYGGTGISWGQRSDSNPYYLIYLYRENYNGDYTKLVLNWHTGIRIGASTSYGGIRFYDNSYPISTTEIFSVGRGDSNIRAANNIYADQFTDINSTGYYIDGPNISVLNQLTVNNIYRSFQSYSGSDNAPVKTWMGTLIAGSDYYGAQAYTIIQTSVPYNSYMMGGFSIDWLENYGSTNAKTTITLGGYWNPPSNSGMIGFEYTSTNPNIRPNILVGYDGSGNTCFVLQHYNSSYCVIQARDLWLGYSGGSSGYGNGWAIYQQGNYSNLSGIVTVQPRLAVAMDSVSYMTAAIGRGSHMSGWLQGSYNSVGDNYAKSNPIYTIGSNYNPSESALENMYGIGYSGSSFGSISHRQDWGMYVAADGDIRVWLDGSGGRVISTGAHYGDVFYQYDNTGYYIDPNGGTSLNVYGRGYFGAAVRGGNYGSVWGSGYSTNALGYANASYTGGGCGHPPWGGSPNFGGFANYPGIGLGAVWSGNSVEYRGGEPGGVFYGGTGTYTSGGGAGIYAQGGDGGYYAQAGAGIYAIGGTNGYWYGVSAYGITRAPAAYFDGNVHIMTPSGSTQCGLNIGYFNYTSNDNSTYLLKVAGPGYFSSYLDTDYTRRRDDTGYYWHLNGSSNVITTVTGYMYFRSNRNTTSDSPPLQAYSNDGGGAIMSFHRSGQYAINFGLDSDNVIRFGGWSASTNRLQMDMSGNLTMAGNVTAYSDIKLKENIEVIENPLIKVKQIRGVTFTRNDTEDKEKRHTGVIAQEVELVLPEVVAEDNSGVKNVAYGNMVGLLIEAIKEQQQIIDSQEDRLEKLEKVLLEKGLV